MGRYIHGTKGFSYKYVFGAQDTNLHQLSDWAGLPSPDEHFTLATQFFGRCQLEDSWELVASVGWLTSVFQATIPSLSLVPDVEGAIYEVGEQWREVIRHIDETLPGTPLSPDIAGGRSFRLRKEEWGQLAARIGRGADPNDLNSLDTARKRAFEDGGERYLPLLAANALWHAVKHDLDVLDLQDESRMRDTNLWEVVADYAYEDVPGGPTAETSWEDRLLFARLYSFQRDAERAMPLYAALLEERPERMDVVGYRFAHHIRQEAWDEVGREADAMLKRVTTDAAKAALQVWRGEAAWCVSGDREAAREDAEMADALGDAGLLQAMVQDLNHEADAYEYEEDDDDDDD